MAVIEESPVHLPPTIPSSQNTNPGQPGNNMGGSFDPISDRFGEVKELEEMFSKLNPLAEEFVPPSLANPSHGSEKGFNGNGFGLDQGLRLGSGRQWVL